MAQDIPHTPWHAAYPAPMAEVESLPRQDLLRWIKEGKVAGKDYVLVDVRRIDLEVRALTIYYLTPEVFDE